MFKRVVLAYDGSLEGAVALREGALLARRHGASVFILSVVPENPAVRMVEGLHAGVVAHQMQTYEDLLKRGVARLKELGFKPVARLVMGEPAKEIGRFAREVRADLVVVGHRRQTMIDRWWSGAAGAFVSDYIGCSLLIARTAVSDEDFDAEVRAYRASAEAKREEP